MVGGLRGQLAGGVLWDASVTAGANTADFSMRNTVNASLGPRRPRRSTRPLRQREVGVNLDLEPGPERPRPRRRGRRMANEQFRIGLGQPDRGGRAPSRPGLQRRLERVARVRPHRGRHLEPRQRRRVRRRRAPGRLARTGCGTAARYEHFADFGATLNGKLSARVPSPGASPCAAASAPGSGAPTPGQQNAFNVSTQYGSRSTIWSTTAPSPRPPPSRGCAAAVPSRPSAPSTSASGSRPRAAPSPTADYFRIDLSDRLTLSRFFALEAAEVEGLLAEGSPAPAICRTSASSPTTWRPDPGVDVVAAWAPPASRRDRHQRRLQPHRHRRHRLQSGPAQSRPDRGPHPAAGGGAARHPLERRRRPGCRPRHAARPPELLRRLVRPARHAPLPRQPVVDLELAWPLGDAVALPSAPATPSTPTRT